MITFLLGIPGSGKTYKAVYDIYYNFSKNASNFKKNKLKKDYLFCVTNINSFKFDLCNNVVPFVYNDFMVNLSKMYNMKVNQNATDDEIIKVAEECNMFKCFFVLDESHNYLNKDNPVLVWWLTYHRHLHQDIVLISQNLSLFHSSYKNQAETFLRAVPASRSLTSKFKYFNYSDKSLSQASKVGVIKLPKIDDVFKLYVSGDVVVTPNILLKYVFVFVFLVVLLVISFYFFSKFFSSSGSHDTVKSVSIVKSNSVLKNNSQSHLLNSSDFVSNRVSTRSLAFFQVHCSLNSLCTYHDVLFPFFVLSNRYYSSYFNIHLIKSYKRFNTYLVYFSASEKFKSFLFSFKNSQGVSNVQTSLNPVRSVARAFK